MDDGKQHTHHTIQQMCGKKFTENGYSQYPSQEKREQLHSKTKWSSSSMSFDMPNGIIEDNADHVDTCVARLHGNGLLQSETSTIETDAVERMPPVETSDKLTLSSMSRDHKVILVSVGLANLLSYFSLSSLAPFFPLEAEKKGVNTTVSGWIFGVVALVKFISSPFFGKLFPVVGTKFVLLSGIFICGGCSLCFGFLDRIDTSNGNALFIVMCFITRILLGLGCAAISNAGFVYLANGFPGNVATAFGIVEMTTGVGMVTGPALGGFLYDAGGFKLPFIVIGASCFLALPIIWLILTPQTYQQDVGHGQGALSMWRVAVQPKALVNSIVVALSATLWSVFDPIMEPHLRQFGAGPSLVGVVFLVMAASYSVSAPLWGRLADKLHDNRSLLVPGFLIVAVGFLIIGPSPILPFNIPNTSLWLPFISVIIISASDAMIIIPTLVIYIDVLRDVGYPGNTHTYGIVCALWASMYSLGDLAGPSLGGFLYQEIGFEWLTTCFAFSALLTCLIVMGSWYLDIHCRKWNVKREEKHPLLPLDTNP